MGKKLLLIALAILFLASAHPAAAQQPKKVPRIGYLNATSASAISDSVEAFLQGLRELGYIEGKNIVIEYRFAEGKLDQVPRNAAELVRLKIDVIVTAGSTDTAAARKATATIPIVMTQDNDPVGSGFIATLARPGGNITGLTNISSELGGKRLELLKEVVPKLSRVVIFGNAANPGSPQALKETEDAARAMGIKLQYLEVRKADDVESAFKAASREQSQALIILPNPVATTYRKQVVGLAVKSRLPAMYFRRVFVESGGLMSYGTYVPDLYRRAATYVDKILKGAKPADLPVEQPMKFEFVINLKTAKALNLTIPQSVLYRTDKVIK
jgi:putative ABC transport system substrate-binding protein